MGKNGKKREAIAMEDILPKSELVPSVIYLIILP